MKPKGGLGNWPLLSSGNRHNPVACQFQENTMPRGIPNPKPVEIEPAIAALPPIDQYDAYAPRSVPLPEPEGPKLARVKLDRNYVPINPYTVVGHLRPEIKRKDPAGNLVVTQTEEFIPGVEMPPKIAGTGFVGKLWAGTVIEIAEAEAKNIVRQKIGSLEFAD